MQVFAAVLVIELLGGAVAARAQTPDVAIFVDLNKLPTSGRATGDVSAAVSEVDPATLSRLTTKAAACIERGAPTVAAADPDLASAVTFLVSDLCAREVTARETYKRSAAMLQMMKQQPIGYSVEDDEGGPSLQTPAQKAAMKKAADQRKRLYQNARVDSETGELKGLESTFPFSGGWSAIGASVEAPADLRALAAERLLAARSSRTGR